MHKTWNQIPPLRKDFQQMEQIFQIMSINLTATYDCWGWWRWHVRNLIADRHAVSALERLSHHDRKLQQHISVISISTSEPSRSSTGTFLALGESISPRRLLSAVCSRALLPTVPSLSQGRTCQYQGIKYWTPSSWKRAESACERCRCLCK